MAILQSPLKSGEEVALPYTYPWLKQYLILDVNSIAPFQSRGARLKWRKEVPRAALLCVFVEFNVNSIARFCVRDAHAKSGFWESCATRNSPKSPFVEFT
jgi:hypothetical protein